MINMSKDRITGKINESQYTRNDKTLNNISNISNTQLTDQKRIPTRIHNSTPNRAYTPINNASNINVNNIHNVGNVPKVSK